MPADFKDHFSTAACSYAARRPVYPPALVDALAARVPAHGLAWDCGCGSGQLSRPLAARFRRVIATDASAEQVARAAPHPRVTYRVVPAERSGLDDASADLAVAAQAAHWFDLATFYAEVRRVVRPGGALALVAYGLMHVSPAVDAVVCRLHDDTLEPYWPPERRHVLDGYRSLPFPFEEEPAPSIAIEADWTADDLGGYVGTWSALRAAERAGTGDALLAAFRRDLAAAWDGEGRRRVRWPLSIRLGRVGGGAATTGKGRR